jgi:hypothetical protein
MELFDFLMPDQAQATHLRSIANQMRNQDRRHTRANLKVSDLETDVNSVALVCMALVATLVEKGVIDELDLKMQLDAIDGLDASDDGGLDMNVLRGALGLKKPDTATLPKPRLPHGKRGPKPR